MVRKIILQGVAAAVILSGLSSAAVIDPITRLEKMKELFTQYGADTFRVLNGQDVGGTGGGESGKSNDSSAKADVSMVINPTDRNSFPFCVENGNWAVYPPEPMKVGTDAMSATDAMGNPFIPSMIEALRSSPNGKASPVPYTIKTPDGRLEKRMATVWSSSALLSRKNDTGKKFFCGTSVKAND